MQCALGVAGCAHGVAGPASAWGRSAYATYLHYLLPTTYCSLPLTSQLEIALRDLVAGDAEVLLGLGVGLVVRVRVRVRVRVSGQGQGWA